MENKRKYGVVLANAVADKACHDKLIVDSAALKGLYDKMVVDNAVVIESLDKACGLLVVLERFNLCVAKLAFGFYGVGSIYWRRNALLSHH